MCTLSVISTGIGAFQLIFSRDESHARAPALPPEWRTSPAGPQYLCPLDTEAGGTWIAATRNGLCLAIMNRNPEPPPTLPPRAMLTSRGLLIPHLIAEPTVSDAQAAMLDLELDRFAPFRLVALEPSGSGWPNVREFAWDREQLSIASHTNGPLCLVSSGLGDSKAAPRLELFSSWVTQDPTPETQRAFHRHRWQDRPEISVLMHRAEARTVSVTTLVVRGGPEPTIQWEYLSVPGDLSPQSVA